MRGDTLEALPFLASAQLAANTLECPFAPVTHWVVWPLGIRSLRERGINVKPKRRKVKTTDSTHSNPVAPNLLQRNFTADAPKWVADITGIGTAEGWLYSSFHCRYLLSPGGGMGE
ncbi:MAG TPA: hypothetical protein VFB12_10560 [Ktedonobacteraceae bacterium]|nr:hypothetical protein [Ktedonobacteraceae bacterium]